MSEEQADSLSIIGRCLELHCIVDLLSWDSWLGCTADGLHYRVKQSLSSPCSLKFVQRCLSPNKVR